VNEERGVLSIGTTEATNAVGLGLDLRLLAERGTPGFMVVAAVSAQDRSGIRDLTPLPPASLQAQLASIDAARVGAIRIGALPSVAAIEVVAAALAHFGGVPVVLDPVRAGSRGGALTSEETSAALRERLLTPATVVLPNLGEASALAGFAVTNDASMEAAGRALVALGARAVLVTGGHLTGDPTDVLVEDARSLRFTAPRLAREMRGTGCVLAVSLAAELASGEMSLEMAIARARATVRTKIAHARRVGDQWCAP